MFYKITRFALSGLLVAFTAIEAMGGTTGNIKGKIADIQTGEALPLVNVLIVGSGRGGVTNDKGEYFITGVQAGTYSVRASLLGYQVFEAKKVTIDADETTVLDFKLASTLIEKEGITVEGARPLVDVKKTAGEQTYNKDKIEQLPNVKGVADVLSLQAGVVKFGTQLFLRGGRANETQILVDGVPVNDVGGGTSATAGQSPNEQLAQLYSGTSTGGGLSVSANAIQSVSVSSSGLDAEYGNAQSGVVNISTKSGGDTYTGSVQYRTDGLTDNSFNERYYAFSAGGPDPITSRLLPELGVEVPGKLSFFVSTTFNQSDGAFGFTQNTLYHPLQRKIRFSGFFGDVLGGLGFKYSDKQNNDFAYNMKLSYGIGDNDQFSFSYRANASSAHPLYGKYGSVARYDSTTSSLSLKTQNVFQWTHILGTNSLIKAFLSRLETDNTTAVAGLTPVNYPAYVSGLDPSNDGFRDVGGDQGWSHSNTVIWNAKIDINSKVHELHFLKGGMEYYYEIINSTTINYPLDLDPQYPNDPNGPGEYPLYGRTRYVLHNLPSHGAMYIQDNIEITSLTIKLGLRYDFFYLGKQVNDPGFVAAYEKAINLAPRGSATYQYADWVDYNADHTSFKGRSFWKQFTSGDFSPRLAIGYPVSERTVFYFNYGHFLQYPDRYQYFSGPKTSARQVSESFTIGNPSLRPQKTIQYEAGFDQLLFTDFSLGIRGFYKDISDYVSPRNPLSDVTQWVNLDFASARGFEVILTKGGGGNYSGSIGYTFQVAKGRTSNPQATIANPGLAQLPREVRLDYDQQHTVNLFLGYHIAANEDFDVLGLNINNWGASVTWNFGSGFPYTPYNLGRSVEDFYLKNSADGPYTSELNISLYKGFSIMDRLNLVFTLDVTNLLNRRNVDLNSPGFNSFTGAVTSYGAYDPQTEIIYPYRTFASSVPPFIFGNPRQISFGMKLNWN